MPKPKATKVGHPTRKAICSFGDPETNLALANKIIEYEGAPLVIYQGTGPEKGKFFARVAGGDDNDGDVATEPDGDDDDEFFNKGSQCPGGIGC